MRTEAQRRADAAYRAKSTSILVRLSPGDLARLDAVRGDQSRTACAQALLTDALTQKTPGHF
jgi:hypothetical protein